MGDTTKWQAGQITECALGIVSVKLPGRDPSPQRVADLCIDHMRRPDTAMTARSG